MADQAKITQEYLQAEWSPTDDTGDPTAQELYQAKITQLYVQVEWVPSDYADLASTEACTSTSTATLSLTDTFVPAAARVSSNSLSLLITLTAVPTSGTVVIQHKLITDTVWITGATLTDPNVDDTISMPVQLAGVCQIRLTTTSGSRSRSMYYTRTVTSSAVETYAIVNISKQKAILILDTVTKSLEPEERIYVSVDLYKTNIIGNRLIRYYKESD